MRIKKGSKIIPSYWNQTQHKNIVFLYSMEIRITNNLIKGL